MVIYIFDFVYRRKAIHRTVGQIAEKYVLLCSSQPSCQSQENHSIITVVFAGGEIPATKLAALQKVLQSDFLNAIREVYEHIYDTVDVQVLHTHTLIYLN